MTITIETTRLSELLTAAAESGATRALIQTGTIATTITLADVKKLHGKKIAYESRKSLKVKWMPVGSGGRSSGVYCLRSEFEKFLFERKFDFNK